MTGVQTCALPISDLFHIPFYNKTQYTGSIKGMRYYIRKQEEDGENVFKVWIFPGPFCFDRTADELKESATFAFTEENIPVIADWLNAQYEARAGYWNQHQSVLS